MNFYELSKELAVIEAELVDAGGELTDELEKRLDACSLDFSSKVNNISKWVLDLEGTEGAIAKELDRLNTRKKAIQNLQSRLKDYMKAGLERANMPCLDCGTMKVSIHKNPPSVEITNKEAIPASFITVKVEHIIDKKALLEALKSGEQVEGAMFVNDKTHLRIK